MEKSKAGGVDTASGRSTDQASSPIKAQLNGIEVMLQQIVSRQHADFTLNPSESVNRSESINPSESVDASHVMTESIAMSYSRREMLRLANKIVLFSKEGIPDPPNMPFSQDIAELDSVWDDLSPQWRNY